MIYPQEVQSKELQFLAEVALSLGYLVEYLDPIHKNALVLSNTNGQFFIASNSGTGMYPGQRKDTASLMKDKTWANLWLKQNGYNIIPSFSVFVTNQYKEYRQPGQEISDVMAWAPKQRWPLFVKPNKATHGRGAQLVWNLENLQQQLKLIAQNDYLAIVSEFVQAREYRIFINNGKVLFSYEKLRQKIKGNGTQTTKELLQDQNIQLDKYHEWQLKQLQLTPDQIVPKDTVIYIRECANLAQGSTITDVKFTHAMPLKNWAKALSSRIGGGICGVDVFAHGANGLTDTDSLQIIELNSNPGLGGLRNNGYKKEATEIWQTILTEYFS